MAQLDIERKPHGSMGWLWLLIALIIIVAVWWFVWGAHGARVATTRADSTAAMVARTPRARDTSAMANAAPPAASVVGATSAVNAFVTFVSDNRSDSMATDHSHTAAGLRNLAAAGEALAGSATGMPAVTARADSLRHYADQLQQASTSSRHSELARQAFMVGATMLRELGPAHNVGKSALDDLQRAAEAVSPRTPLLEQRSAVQHYWDTAASVVTTEGGKGS